MKKLGFGLMRLPLLDEADISSIDIDQAKKMVDLFIGRGFTYFDTAWMYHNFKSEDAVREILTSRYPRNAYQIATKLHAEYFDSAKGREDIFTSQLKKIKVDYFDYYLLHDMNKNYYEKYKKLGCVKWLAQKKSEGLVKNIGFSFHDTADVLDMILTENPDFDFVQLQINYLDWESESVQSRQCYETARKHNKAIIIMEPIKGGLLSQLPIEAEQLMREVHPDWCPAEWALKFATGLEGIIAVLSGMSSLSQMEENTRFVSGSTSSVISAVDNKVKLDSRSIPDSCPSEVSASIEQHLSDNDLAILRECARIINSNFRIPCTGCNYCIDGCPKNIPIPRIFSLYNAEYNHRISLLRYAEHDHKTSLLRYAEHDHKTSLLRNAEHDHKTSLLHNAEHDHKTSLLHNAEHDHKTSLLHNAEHDHKTSLLHNAEHDHKTSLLRNAEYELDPSALKDLYDGNEVFKRVRDCVECGGCEIICPQGLEIRNYLKNIARHLI